jgi:hypothetical protein
MDSNDYYRNFHQYPSYGRKIMQKLFESGLEADGYPGLQQAIQNIIHDKDGCTFSIVKPPTIVYDGTPADTFTNTTGYYFKADGFNILAAGEFLLSDAHYLYLTTGGVLTGYAITGAEGMLLGYRPHETNTFVILQNSRKLTGGQYLQINTEKQHFISPVIFSDVTGNTMNYNTGIITELTGTRMMLTSGNIEELDVERFTSSKIISGNLATISGLTKMSSLDISGSYLNMGTKGYINEFTGSNVKVETNQYVENSTGNYMNILSKGYFNQITGLDVNFTALTGTNAVFTNTTLGNLTANVDANGFSINEINMVSGLTVKANLLTGVNITGQNAYFTNLQASALAGDLYGGYKNITNLLSVQALTGTFSTGIMNTGQIGYLTGVNYLTGNYGNFLTNCSIAGRSPQTLTAADTKLTVSSTPYILGTAGSVITANVGNSSSTLCVGNDARLSDTRVPKMGTYSKVSNITMNATRGGYSYPVFCTVYVHADSDFSGGYLHVTNNSTGELICNVGVVYTSSYNGWSRHNSTAFLIPPNVTFKLELVKTGDVSYDTVDILLT